MPLPAQKFREMVFQMLYAYDSSHSVEADVIELLMHELKVTKKSAIEASRRVQLVLERKIEIDEMIRPASTEYQFERISSVEKNILRLGVYELCFDDAIPAKVAITEAIRLCRKFGTPESAHFVNAILDRIYKGSPCASKSCCEPAAL
jgi:transcription antitermination protein NusB